MNRIVTLLTALALVIGISAQTNATLILQGTGISVYGTYNLIYDNDLDITWYDFTKPYDIWQNQVNWADGLTVTFGGNTYDDWRLPSTWGYDGTTETGRFNDTSSEMGHLYYTELGNLGYYDTSGSYQPGWGLTNTGDFENLQADFYWTDVLVPSLGGAVGFFFLYGNQDVGWAGLGSSWDEVGYAVAVRPGNVSTMVPEPATLFLLSSGLAGMIVWGKRLRRKQS